MAGMNNVVQRQNKISHKRFKSGSIHYATSVNEPSNGDERLKENMVTVSQQDKIKFAFFYVNDSGKQLNDCKHDW